MSLRTERAQDKTGNRVISQQLKSGALQPGVDEAAVKWMQRMLKLAGYNPGPAGTRFTPATQAALQQFQSAVGLPQSGALDDATFAQLKNVEGRVRANELKRDGFEAFGQKSTSVAKDQRELKALGYTLDRTDGVFDSGTATAVRAFRKDQGLRPGSTVTQRLSAAIRGEVAGLDHRAYRERLKPSRQHSRLDSSTALEAARLNPDGSRGVGAGSSSRSIRNVQAHLLAAGFDPKGITGVWDSRSQAALQAFQGREGLPQTGRVDFATWGKLKGAYLYAHSATSPAQRLGERSGAVKQTEKELSQLGYHVRVDGLFDAGTQRAVNAFRRKDHLGSNGGAVDGRTAQALQKAVSNSPSALAQRIIKLAASQIGTTGMDGGGGQKYSNYFGRGAEAYCADFVSWVYSHAGKPLNYAYVPYLENHLKATGQWTQTPKPGDIVIFSWDGGATADHTGIVKRVNSDGTIETIEGNTTNPRTGQFGVWEKTRPRSEILGYGRL